MIHYLMFLELLLIKNPCFKKSINFKLTLVCLFIFPTSNEYTSGDTKIPESAPEIVSDFIY